MSMLRWAKLAVLEAMRATCVMNLVSHTDWRRRKLVILCYHGISMIDEHLWDPALFMPVDLFEKRLKVLRDGGFHVLPLGEALEQLHIGTLPPKAVVLTFDDGLADFYYRAFPLLRQYKMPATVYLSTYYCYNNIPVFGVMARYLMWRGRASAGIIQDASLGWNTPQDLSTAEGAASAYRLLEDFVDGNNIPAARREELAEILAGHLKLDYQAIRSTQVLNLMTPAQVKEIHDGGMSVELHTHRHRTPRDAALFVREIGENREKIADITGQVPRHFCYPSGVWRPEMLPLLTENGVTSATTCEPGLTMRATSPLLLPRHIDTTSQTRAEFEGWLSGVSQFLPKRAQNREA
jgi:peptidoglycan/xylan/chitin deacetylase (PgdA/CDA1 family)